MAEHVIAECMDEAERFALKTMLVDLLLARRSMCCPGCISDLLRELADEGDTLWSELNHITRTCRH